MGFNNSGDKGLKNFLKGLMCEPDGTPSSTRVLMYLFSLFTIVLLSCIFFHVLRLADPTRLSLWLSNMPILIGALIGLIALPYTVNRGATSMSDVAAMITSLRSGATTVQGKSGAGNGNSSPATGSDGPKG